MANVNKKRTKNNNKSKTIMAISKNVLFCSEKSCILVVQRFNIMFMTVENFLIVVPKSRLGFKTSLFCLIQNI